MNDDRNSLKQLIRVLVVDDSVNLRQVIKRYLEMGFNNLEIHEAGDGEKAEAILQESAISNEPIDMIFLDWMMPKVSGYEFLQRIRSTDIFKNDPSIIMLTAETYADQMNACMKYGVSTYITKPFTAEELISSVKKILQDRELKYAV